MEPVLFGRRKNDKASVEVVVREVMNRLGQSMKPDLPRDIRRPRRHKKQLKEAFDRATMAIKAAHPEWDALSVARRARSLVRQYKAL